MTSMADWGLYMAPDWRPVTLTDALTGQGPARREAEEPVDLKERERWAQEWKDEAFARRVRLGLITMADIPETI